MLLLKLALVVLISEIGERALCAASSAEENKIVPKTLPQELLINETSDGCFYQLLSYIDEHGMGFLTVNCTKVCTGKIQKTDVDGNPCVASWSYLDSTASITVQEGLCDHGFCKPLHPTKDQYYSVR
uniref:Putative secreted salivary gland peptide n=1 Tax=Ixodes ricinus TaxID=34613 RepID=A0A0K8RLH5_IXORI